jgi:hypothetical protein
MRGKSPVLARFVKVSAVVLGAGLLITGCSPVKMGAAAVVGNQRITIATLDTEVTSLSESAKHYPGIVNLSATQETQEALGWLVRFKINEELAQQRGITVSSAQASSALATIYASAASSAESQGVKNVTLALILDANGIPPNMSAELGRYQAIETQYIEQLNGGKIPTASAAQTATTAKLERAQCVAAKTLNIKINPQYGQLNYTQYSIVAAPVTVTRAGGAVKATSTAGSTPAC